MGRIYYLLGKSATGKDTLYKEILKRRPKLRTVTMYTTRPIREGETDGVEYFFVDQERFDEMMDEEKIIEFRSYNTKCGIWTYFTADDGQIELWQYDYLVIGTIESYYALKEYFGGSIIYRSRRWIKTVEGVRKRTGTAETAVCRTVQKISCRCRRFLGGESGKGGNQAEISKY